MDQRTGEEAITVILNRLRFKRLQSIFMFMGVVCSFIYKVLDRVGRLVSRNSYSLGEA